MSWSRLDSLRSWFLFHHKATGCPPQARIGMLKKHRSLEPCAAFWSPLRESRGHRLRAQDCQYLDHFEIKQGSSTSANADATWNQSLIGALTAAVVSAAAEFRGPQPKQICTYLQTKYPSTGSSTLQMLSGSSIQANMLVLVVYNFLSCAYAWCINNYIQRPNNVPTPCLLSILTASGSKSYSAYWELSGCFHCAIMI